MTLDIKAMGLTSSLLFGGSIFMTGLANLIFPGYGTAFLELVASVYPGYSGTPSIGQVVLGSLYGLLDGFLAGAIAAWIYNFLRSSAEPGKLHS